MRPIATIGLSLHDINSLRSSQKIHTDSEGDRTDWLVLELPHISDYSQSENVALIQPGDSPTVMLFVMVGSKTSDEVLIQRTLEKLNVAPTGHEKLPQTAASKIGIIGVELEEIAHPPKEPVHTTWQVARNTHQRDYPEPAAQRATMHHRSLIDMLDV